VGGKAGLDVVGRGELGVLPMRILHAMSNAADGAMERAFEHTVVALSRHGVAQRVIVQSHSESLGCLKSAGLVPMELPFRKRFDFTSKRRLNNEVSTFGAEIVVTWTPDFSSYVFHPQVKHIGYVTNDFAFSKFKTCDHLFTVTQQRFDRALGAGWSKSKITKLPPVIRSGSFTPVDRKTFFTPDTAKLLVFVGGLRDAKGLDVLLEATARISGYYLWVVGDGPDKKKYEEHAVAIGIKPRTRFVGPQSDILPLMAAADLVVCPARQDDLGEQVLQAWACSKPVVASESLGPSLLINHGDNGVLVPVNDSRSLEEAIKWLDEDVEFAQRIATAGASTFLKSYHEDIAILKYLKFFESVLVGNDETAPVQ
jgi:glycosyltransferase involved in cell wall biosynthesis